MVILQFANIESVYAEHHPRCLLLRQVRSFDEEKLVDDLALGSGGFDGKCEARNRLLRPGKVVHRVVVGGICRCLLRVADVRGSHQVLADSHCRRAAAVAADTANAAKFELESSNLVVGEAV